MGPLTWLWQLLFKLFAPYFLRQVLTKDNGLNARLQEGTKKWAAKDVVAEMPDEDPSTLAESINLTRRLPHGQSITTPVPKWDDLARILKARIPTNWEWFEASWERVELVRRIHQGRTRDFYLPANEAQARKLLGILADKWIEVCYTDPLFLGRNVADILDHVKSLCDHRPMAATTAAQLEDIARICTRRALFTKTYYEKDETGEAMFLSLRDCNNDLAALKGNIEPPEIRPLVMRIRNELDELGKLHPKCQRLLRGKSIKRFQGICNECDHHKLIILGILRRLQVIGNLNLGIPKTLQT